MRSDAWIDLIEPGDVVVFKSGTRRTVLAVHQRQERRRGNVGTLHSACFPIMHCSWTKAGYTVLLRADIKSLARYRLPGLGLGTIAKGIPRRLAREVQARMLSNATRTVTCCQVAGVFE